MACYALTHSLIPHSSLPPPSSLLPQGIVACYVHNAAGPLMGQAGALVGIKTDATGETLTKVGGWGGWERREGGRGRGVWVFIHSIITSAAYHVSPCITPTR